MTSIKNRKQAHCSLAILCSLAVLPLGACGSGGGSVTGSGGTVALPSTVPVPPPRSAVPAPAQPGPAQPIAAFDTAEYRANAKLAQTNATTAYASGITGKGVTLAILDTGLDIDSAEFAGRLAPGSGNFLPTGVFDDQDGHGTAVASVILGAKNDAGTHGVAYEATVFSGRILSNFLRARTTNPTQAEVQQENVDFYTGFANSLNQARTVGAQAVNLSIGFSDVTVSNPGAPAPPSAPLNFAVAQYDAAVTAALRDGVVFVVAGGNEAAAQPNSFPRQILAAATLRAGDAPVLIVGALAEDGQTMASFSNRAGTGTAANYFIVAPGVRVTAPDNTGALFNFSGTSLAAPFVTGALGLVLQAFPTLTAPRAADLLLRTATDLGAPGTDPVFGRGALNIARAFQPQGAQRVATSGGVVDLAQLTGSVMMGAGVGGAPELAQSLKSVVFYDDYDRVFTADLSSRTQVLARAGTVQSAADVRPVVRAAQLGDQLSVDVSGRKSFGARPLIRDVEARVQRQLAPGLQMWFASGGPATGAGFAGQLVTQNPARLFGLAQRDVGSGVEFGRGNWRLHSSWSRGRAAALIGTAPDAPAQNLDLALEHATADHAWRAGVQVSAQRALDGPRSIVATPTGSRRVMLELAAHQQLGAWTLSATAQAAQLRIDLDPRGLASAVQPMTTTAFALEARWQLAPGRALMVGIAQPMRVERGALLLDLPVFADGPGLRRQRIGLQPTGRELDFELGSHWQVRDTLLVRTSLFARTSPEHLRTARPDVGAFMGLSTTF